MKRRYYKIAALVVSGGTLLQFAGCGVALADMFAQNFIGLIVGNLITALLGLSAGAAAA